MAKILNDKRFLWALFSLITLAILLSYVWSSWQAGQGQLLMPLDDVYIHFQYARQMALGHPYQYNLSDPPTSGATSFIYPYLLAFGYLIGFQGLWLGLWAMLLGALALLASLWAVYRLGLVLDAPNWLSLLMALGFALTGSIAWHFMSGMETGLMIALCLWTLLFVLEKRLNAFVLVASALALTRPEGGALAGIAAAIMFLWLWQDYAAKDKNRGKRWRLLLLMLPILMLGVQPLVNLLITGTSVATGNQAKSILATVPQDWGLILSRILDNFGRMWLELLTGLDGREGRGWYMPALIGLLGLGAIPMLLLKKGNRLIGLMLLGWFLVMTAAVSTLDTAFWHFKRYQMPMLALLFPLCLWVISAIGRKFPKPVYAYGVILLIFSAGLYIQFLYYYAVNVRYVYQQPYQMALWLRENTPEDARIAVHDVGLMRYMGERETLDMVGLTTPDAAAYWRNGPGSVAEFLLNEQPDYIASYGRGHGYGLAFLADTSLYANQVAAFTVENWQREINVALAADSQGIYQPDWEKATWPEQVVEYSEYLVFSSVNAHLLNVGDVVSEQQFDYEWQGLDGSGFNTEVRDIAYFHKSLVTLPFIDAYRLITGEERFRFSQLDAEQDALLVSRVHSAYSGTLDIYVNGEFLAQRVIPQNAGYWLDIPTLIPSEWLSENLQIRIVPQMNEGAYMPAFHRLTQGDYVFEASEEASLASYQGGAIRLLSVFPRDDMRYGFQLSLEWETNGNAEGDYRFFVHLYDDVNEPPIDQADAYAGGNRGLTSGSSPIGNWLAGQFSDTITLGAGDIPNGSYSLAIGFYNPQNPQDRLMPESDVYEVSDDGRLWLGEVEINR